ncbi:Hypothetical protein A7982_06928 [Minicystis rosea]|nr:Hypothetical protein A7982_06928 [Minicystis rosea]
MIRTKLSGLATMALCACLSGCGVGAIFFKAEGDGPPDKPVETTQVFDIECKDAFQATGGRTVLGSRAGNYSVSCTHKGEPLHFRILGQFSAAPMAAGKWDKYRLKVIEKARRRGCPGVAVRVDPPTENQEGEAIGAFCVAL